MAKKSIHTGRSVYRFQDNPTEKIFARAWQEINENYPGMSGPMTLDYLLAEDSNRPMNEVTERDAEVAATVIQWLGSHVGQCWLKDTLNKMNLSVIPSGPRKAGVGLDLVTLDPNENSVSRF